MEGSPDENIAIPRKKLRLLVEENEQLHKINERLTKDIKHRDELLSEYESDNLELQSTKQHVHALESKMKSLESENKYLRDLVVEKTTDVSNALLELKSTQRQLSDAQKMINEMERPPSAHDISLPPSEPSNSAEFAKLQEDLNTAIFDLHAAKQREETLEAKLCQLQSAESNLEEEKQDLKKTLKAIKDEKVDLECQLNELRTMHPSARQGNSMFGEVADEYLKLKEDTMKVMKELKLVKKENNQLRDEIEEAHLLSTKREGLEKIGRCVCDELKPELENERLRADRLQRTIHSLEMQIQRAGRDFSAKDVGPIFKSMFDSMKSQLDCANKENVTLRIERNTLKDQASSLKVAMRLAENRASMGEEEVTLLKKQIEIMRHNHSKEIARLEHPELFDEEATESAPQLSKMFKLNQTSVQATFETPAKMSTTPTALGSAMKTPAIPQDPLRRLTMNKSHSKLCESNNETGLERRRRDKTKKALAPKSLVSGFFEPIVLESRNGLIVKVDVPEETGRNETMAIFDKPTSSLPSAKFKIPSLAPLKLGSQKPPMHQNKTTLASQSMELGTTATDLFDFDYSENPFDGTNHVESDEENDAPAQ